MGPSRRYRFVFAPVTREHLAAIDRRYHSLAIGEKYGNGLRIGGEEIET
ncbi:MAG: hypothetical protein ACP5UQ_10195 [Anaerolineae bacterium]